VRVELSAPSLAASQRWSDSVRLWLRGVPGLADVREAYAATQPVTELSLRRARLADRGLVPQQVIGALAGALGGVPATELRETDRRTPIAVRYAGLANENLDAALRTPIRGVPLAQLVAVREVRAPLEVVRAYVRQAEHKYLRALGAFYVRLTARAVDVYATIEPLLADYRKLAARSPGVRVSNRGGWHSRRGLLTALAAAGGRAGVAAALLRRAVAHAVAHAEAEAAAEGAPPRRAAALRAALAARCAPDARAPPELTALQPRHAWANVSRAEHYNGLHDHEGALWSGVFYAKVPPACAGGGSGALVLRTAVGGLTSTQAAAAAAPDAAETPSPAVGWCRFAAVEPREGMLLLFPGWLPHAVLPLRDGPTCQPRISISFNVGRLGVE
jgi:uncharacterized protein (TIGR02466 family)